MHGRCPFKNACGGGLLLKGDLRLSGARPTQLGSWKLVLPSATLHLYYIICTLYTYIYIYTISHSTILYYIQDICIYSLEFRWGHQLARTRLNQIQLFWLQVGCLLLAFCQVMSDESDLKEVNEEPQTRSNPLQGLADDLEDIAAIRKYTMKNKALLSWPSPQKVGVVSNKSLKMNARVLEIVLMKWCPVAPDRKTVPVHFLKQQARVQHWLQPVCNLHKLALRGICCNDSYLQIIELRESMELPENIGLTHCEGHAIKSFVSRLIRMHDGTRKRETLQHFMKSPGFFPTCQVRVVRLLDVMASSFLPSSSFLLLHDCSEARRTSSAASLDCTCLFLIAVGLAGLFRLENRCGPR